MDVRELDDVNLIPTGIEHTTEIANDLDEFTFDNTTDISSSFVEITATGYYFDKVSAIDSPRYLTLSAFVDLTRTTEANINSLLYPCLSKPDRLSDYREPDQRFQVIF